VFVERTGSRLRAALVAAYGPDVGADAAAEALAYGFEHWDELESMSNPAGYLYRVGQTRPGATSDRLRSCRPSRPPASRTSNPASARRWKR